MDDSMYVYDGTNENGGAVRIKVSDKFQTEINKVNPISNYSNHIVYTRNTDNWEK
jgi:hypothetical protein